jgi:ankyrin repeat protein
MTDSRLPERPSLEYLKKLAKDRLKQLRKKNPLAKLASAQLAVARDYGFASWRAMKTAIEQQQTGDVARFFEACTKDDVATLREILARKPDLARMADPEAPHGGWTGLHTAAQRGHPAAVRLLLDYGADPNAREAGDHTYPLHWAAALGHLEIARILLDAGTDAHGVGDDHALDVIGWATVFGSEGEHCRDMAALLVERGAKHHVFSAIATGDLELIRTVVRDNPEALNRRRSRFEDGQTSLHFAMERKRYDILDLLIALGADLEAKDNSGKTAFAVALLRGDREAIGRLHAAGAKPPSGWEVDSRRGRGRAAAEKDFGTATSKLGSSTRKCVAMLSVPDVARTLDWYKSIGFRELNRLEEGGIVNWAMVSFGGAEFMFNRGGGSGSQNVAFWLYTNRVEQLYQLFRSRQLEAARALLAGDTNPVRGIEFIQDIYNPPYGGREFGIRDLNGYVLNFLGSPGEE